MKVVEINNERIIFEDGTMVYSDHNQDCCESHWLDFEHIKLEDFDGLDFDLTNDNFFTRIEGYGISLNPTNGFPVRIAGYGSNNGYYSDNLDLVVDNGRSRKVYNITECQVIND